MAAQPTDAGTKAKESFWVAETLAAEHAAIWGLALPNNELPDQFGKDAKLASDRLEEAYFASVLARDQAAICLSGGGVRSASFCLGVIQALAARGVLHRFHYLSTVSGGGYIGAWLQRWLFEARFESDPAQPIPFNVAAKAVEAALRRDAAAAPPLDALRDFTSYLNPQPGLTSPDTWTGIVLWGRNVLINWSLFLPAMLALASVPLLYRDTVAALAGMDRVQDTLFIVALMLLVFATYSAVLGLPSHAASVLDSRQKRVLFMRPARIQASVVCCGIAWAVLLPLALPDADASPRRIGSIVQAHNKWLHDVEPSTLYLAVIVLALLAAYAFAWLVAARKERPPSRLTAKAAAEAAAGAAAVLAQKTSAAAVAESERAADAAKAAATAPPGTARAAAVMAAAAGASAAAAMRVASVAAADAADAAAALRATAQPAMEGNADDVEPPQTLRNKRLISGLFLANLLPWLAASLAVGAGLWLGLWLARTNGADTRQVAVFGPPWVLFATLLLSLVFVALRQRALRADLDREWLGRLSALKIVPIVLCGCFAAICVFGPHLPALVAGGTATPAKPATSTTAWSFVSDWGNATLTQMSPAAPSKPGGGWSAVYTWATASMTAITGAFSALFGKSDKSAFTISPEKRGLLSMASTVNVSTLLFAVGLFLLLSMLVEGMAKALEPWFAAHVPPGESWWKPAPVAAVFAGGYALSWLLGRQINVNRFSMHAVYRNRLQRAFLGSARARSSASGAADPARPAARPDTADPFTGFDPLDNVRLDDLKPQPKLTRTLFPVVNAALNLTAENASRHAWAERKAAPFTFTPLFCGSETLPAHSAFVPSRNYAGKESETGAEDEEAGVSLATAMTISGAAVSPNMGYHSSAATAFLMTLFNVRLGAWLPNPAVADPASIRKTRPKNALFTFAREMLGMADSKGNAVYLSDGGHFEDLGLYQMVRRRCRLILVVDAGEDPDFHFADLGNAIRKIEVDMPVRITFPPMPMAKAPDWKPTSRHWVMGRIDYLDKDNPAKPRASGRILYVRPCMFDAVPSEVHAYWFTHPTFPHESTVNQFFTESQFESYRKLGAALVGQLGNPADTRATYATVAAYFDAVEAAGKA